MRLRKRILDFYVDNNDTISLDYAIAKVEYYSAQEGYKTYSDVINDAKDILWNSWKNNQLDDNGKEKLITAILMSSNKKLFTNSEQELLDILSVVNSIEDFTNEMEIARQAMILSLVNIYMEDIKELMVLHKELLQMLGEILERLGNIE